MRRGDLLIIAERALELLPAKKLKAVVGDRIRMADLTLASPATITLLEEVRKFHVAALARGYYEPFDVNWRNSTAKSPGTDAFIAEFERLLDRCVAAACRAPRAPTRQAFEMLFDLLRLIDEGREIIFFADEGGSFEVNSYWRVALPAYFRCIADDASPAELAREVDRAISDFDEHERSFHMAAAKRLARGEQRAALRGVSQQPRRG